MAKAKKRRNKRAAERRPETLPAPQVQVKRGSRRLVTVLMQTVLLVLVLWLIARLVDFRWNPDPIDWLLTVTVLTTTAIFSLIVALSIMLTRMWNRGDTTQAWKLRAQDSDAEARRAHSKVASLRTALRKAKDHARTAEEKALAALETERAEVAVTKQEIASTMKLAASATEAASAARSQAEDELQAAQDANRAAEAIRSDLERAVADAEQRGKEADARIAHATSLHQTELAAVREEASAASDQATEREAAFGKQLASKVQAQAELEAKLAEAESRFETELALLKDDSASQAEAAQAEITSLKAEIAKMESSRAELQRQVAAAEENTRAQSNECSSLRGRISGLEQSVEQLEEARAKFTTLRLQIANELRVTYWGERLFSVLEGDEPVEQFFEELGEESAQRTSVLLALLATEGLAKQVGEFIANQLAELAASADDSADDSPVGFEEMTELLAEAIGRFDAYGLLLKVPRAAFEAVVPFLECDQQLVLLAANSVAPGKWPVLSGSVSITDVRDSLPPSFLAHLFTVATGFNERCELAFSSPALIAATKAIDELKQQTLGSTPESVGQELDVYAVELAISKSRRLQGARATLDRALAEARRQMDWLLYLRPSEVSKFARELFGDKNHDHALSPLSDIGRLQHLFHVRPRIAFALVDVSAGNWAQCGLAEDDLQLFHALQGIRPMVWSAEGELMATSTTDPVNRLWLDWVRIRGGRANVRAAIRTLERSVTGLRNAVEHGMDVFSATLSNAERQLARKKQPGR